MSTLALMQVSQEELQKEILHTWQDAKESGIFGIPAIELHLGPVDISINKAVWFLWIGAAVTFLILFIGSRLLKDRPGAYQVIVEELYGFGRKQLAGQMGEEGMKFLPYTLSLFVFILVLNLIGLIPNSYPVTSSISFTLVLAIFTLLIYNYVGIRRRYAGQADHGPVHVLYRGVAAVRHPATYAGDATLRQHPGGAPHHLRLFGPDPVLRGRERRAVLVCADGGGLLRV